MATVAPGRFVAPSQLPVAGTFEPNDFLLGLVGTPLSSRRIRLESLLAFLESRIVELAVGQAVGQALALLGDAGESITIVEANADAELQTASLLAQVITGGTAFTLPSLPESCFCFYINATGVDITIAGQTMPADYIAVLVKAAGMSQGKMASFGTSVWTNI